MKDETGKGTLFESPSWFLLVQPSFFNLDPPSFLSVSAEKLLNVRVLSLAQAFVSAAKNNVAFAHHHHFAVN